MQTLTEAIWRLKPLGGLFNEAVVVTRFPVETPAARRNLVYRAAQAGEIAILRRGLYVLAEPFRQAAPEPAVLAPMLYGPSYLSFESALRFHALIPDVVQNAGAATSRRSRVFDTALGNFTFTTVPVEVLMAGVRSVPFESGSQTVTGLVASPARAIADLVYTRREVSWENDGRRFLEESLRIDRDELAAKLRPEELEATLATFRHRRVRAFLEGLRLSLARPPKTGRSKEGKPR